ncbi:MAG: transcription antitermination protein NusB, partial [Clostridia bacterium]
FNKDDQTDITKDTLLEDVSITQSDRDYMDTVTCGVKDHYSELIELIKNNSKNFKVERIFKTDLSALLLACYEMKYVRDIPMAVSICEIVDLVKCYSTEKSSLFVNGVLAGVCKELSADKEIMATKKQSL